MEELRSPFNLGSIARSAEAFGAFAALPVTRCEEPAATPRVPIFALESGGTSIEAFPFPQHGVCLVGSEELGLSPKALARADASLGRCTIPLHGAKGSLNVGVACGILLAHWTTRLSEKKSPAAERQGVFDRLREDYCSGLR